MGRHARRIIKREQYHQYAPVGHPQCQLGTKDVHRRHRPRREFSSHPDAVDQQPDHRTVQFIRQPVDKSHVAHIGMTCAYNGGRPQVAINGHPHSFPGSSTQPNSRSYTTGTWRGNNVNEANAIPAGGLVVGQNTLTITPVSGSTDLGPWLSAGWVYDAVELDIPNTAPAAPVAPDNLTAGIAGSSQINLTWTDNSTNEVNFLIERSTDGVNFSLIGAVTFAVTNFTDPNISSGTTYFYRVPRRQRGCRLFRLYSNRQRATGLQHGLSVRQQSGLKRIWRRGRQRLLYLDLNKCELARGAMATRGDKLF